MLCHSQEFAGGVEAFERVLLRAVVGVGPNDALALLGNVADIIAIAVSHAVSILSGVYHHEEHEGREKHLEIRSLF